MAFLMLVTVAYNRCRRCLQGWDVNDFIQQVGLYILVHSNPETLDRIEKRTRFCRGKIGSWFAMPPAEQEQKRGNESPADCR